MRWLGLLAAAITLLTAAPASADTFTVNTNLDTGGVCGNPCSIRAALASASANGATTEDLIVVPANTYQLGSELTVDSRVVIRGAGARTTAIRGDRPASGAPWRVFDIGAVQAMIESLTMENGGAGAENGGNLRNLGGTVLLDHVRVTNGLASSGGGIANEMGSMTIRDSLIDTNQGGGIVSIGGNAPASLAVHDSTVAFNTGNTAVELVQTGQPSTGRLEHVTVARNASGGDPGGIGVATPGALRVRASIIADNTGDSAGDVNCSGPLTSEGANIESDADCGLTAATGDLPSTEAGLSANLEVAGGQTNVFTIGTGSPAINRAGSCAGADQRDLPRPQGGACDSGAFEVDQAPDTQLVATPPTFRFSSSEPGVRFECRLDRPTRTGAPFACVSPASFPDLPPGSYTFVVRAIDGGGQGDPSPAAAAFAVQTPRPNAGTSVVVNRVRGKVLVKVPGGRFVDLSRITEIPDGSIIDTRKGVVALVFEPRRGAKTQKAKFYDGVFKVDQRGRIMQLVLVEKLAKCKQGDASAAARKKKRRLWGDGKGRFRTKGKYSSATVRGTKWLTQDSCGGTLTKVRKGKVSVRDFVKRRTVKLKKGQQYLARPNR